MEHNRCRGYRASIGRASGRQGLGALDGVSSSARDHDRDLVLVCDRSGVRETLRKNGFAIFFDIASAHARLAPGVQLYPRPRGTFERGITRMTAAFAILVGLAVFGTARKGKRDG